MGKDFQVAKPEFQTDFIYQPNWELLGKALLKKDAELQQQANTIELYRNVPINHRPEEAEYALAEQQNLEQKVQGLAEQMTNDSMNPTIAARLSAVTRELQNNFKSGKIAQIQKSKAEADLLLEETKKLKSPAAKEMALNQLKLHDLRRAATQQYTPFTKQNPYDEINILDEFFGSKVWSSLKDTMSEKDKAGVFYKDGILHVTNNTTQLTKDTIRKAFMGYVQNDANMKGYMGYYDTFSGDKETYLDKKGDIDFENGKLSKDFIASEAAEYVKPNFHGSFDPRYTNGSSVSKMISIPTSESQIYNTAFTRSVMASNRSFQLRKELENIQKKANSDIMGVKGYKGKGIPQQDIKATNATEGIHQVMRYLDKQIADTTNRSTDDIKALEVYKKRITELIDHFDNSMSATTAPLLEKGGYYFGQPQLVKALDNNLNSTDGHVAILNSIGRMDLKGARIDNMNENDLGVYLSRGASSLKHHLYKPPGGGPPKVIKDVVITHANAFIINKANINDNYIHSLIQFTFEGYGDAVEEAELMTSMSHFAPISKTVNDTKSNSLADLITPTTSDDYISPSEEIDRYTGNRSDPFRPAYNLEEGKNITYSGKIDLSKNTKGRKIADSLITANKNKILQGVKDYQQTVSPNTNKLLQDAKLKAEQDKAEQSAKEAHLISKGYTITDDGIVKLGKEVVDFNQALEDSGYVTGR